MDTRGSICLICQELLASHADERARAALARQPGIDPTILDRLTGDASARVAIAAAAALDDLDQEQ